MLAGQVAEVRASRAAKTNAKAHLGACCVPPCTWLVCSFARFIVRWFALTGVGVGIALTRGNSAHTCDSCVRDRVWVCVRIRPSCPCAWSGTVGSGGASVAPAEAASGRAPARGTGTQTLVSANIYHTGAPSRSFYMIPERDSVEGNHILAMSGRTFAPLRWHRSFLCRYGEDKRAGEDKCAGEEVAPDGCSCAGCGWVSRLRGEGGGAFRACAPPPVYVSQHEHLHPSPW